MSKSIDKSKNSESSKHLIGLLSDLATIFVENAGKRIVFYAE